MAIRLMSPDKRLQLGRVLQKFETAYESQYFAFPVESDAGYVAEAFRKLITRVYPEVRSRPKLACTRTSFQGTVITSELGLSDLSADVSEPRFPELEQREWSAGDLHLTQTWDEETGESSWSILVLTRSTIHVPTLVHRVARPKAVVLH